MCYQNGNDQGPMRWWIYCKLDKFLNQDFDFPPLTFWTKKANVPLIYIGILSTLNPSKNAITVGKNGLSTEGYQVTIVKLKALANTTDNNIPLIINNILST